MKTVADYQNDIQLAEAEIAKIQASCLHNQGYKCVMYSWRPGAVYATRMCLLCSIPMAGITSEESVEAYNASFTSVVTVTNQEVS